MPFTKNQIITLEIEALSNDGNGVAHKDGQAVFVPLTAPGDVADPWYTGDFEATWQDVLEGCTALLEELR